MTKTRIFLFATLALIMAFGAFGQSALADDSAPFHFRVVAAPGHHNGVTPDVGAPAAVATFQSVGPNPPVDTSSSISWPNGCGPSATGSPCTSDPIGSILVGVPQETWSASGCTSSSAACAQLINLVDSNTATGDFKVQVEVKQGTKVIADSGLQDLMFTFPAGNGYFIYGGLAFGPGNCAKGVTCVAPVPGIATITQTDHIGTTVVKTVSTITLQ
jgi:hypothetical protein